MSYNVGRHRASGRYNPATELGQIVTEVGTPLAKGSAVVAASGGLVAAIAVPAQAATLDAPTAQTQAQTKAHTQTAGAVDAAGTERAAQALEEAGQSVAVTAPAAKDSEKSAAALGKVAVEAVAKPTGPTEEELRQRAEAAAAEAEAEERAQAAREQAEETASRSEERPTPESSSTSSDAGTSSDASTSSDAAPESSPEPAPSTGGVIGIAKQYIGTPYVYGGTTPSGFDCSGFTQYVFGKAGISLPRVTTAQRAATTPVSNPQPGDLVFFGSPAYHVGIYLGDGMMIDSPNSGKSVSVRPVFNGVSGYGRV